jgi:hypothetical protein
MLVMLLLICSFVGFGFLDTVKKVLILPMTNSGGEHAASFNVHIGRESLINLPWYGDAV